MVSNYKPPDNILELLRELRYYGQLMLTSKRLEEVAKYVDNPDKLKQLEEEWLYGPIYDDYGFGRWSMYD